MLELGAKLREQTDQEERLQTLQQQINDIKGGRNGDRKTTAPIGTRDGRVAPPE
jgi:hypothetical protein